MKSTNKSITHPPQWADKLLEWRCPNELLEEIQGDLHELFEERVEEVGERKARRKYALYVLGYLRPFAFKRTLNQATKPLYRDMLHNYITVALRTMKRNKVFSFINISGLSMGLACCMLIVLYTKDEVSYDRFHINNPNIYRITYKSFAPGGHLEHVQEYTGYIQGPSFSRRVPEIQSFVRFQGNQKDVKLGNEVISQTVYFTDADFFSIFSFPLLAGNPKAALREPNSVVISEDIAQKHFGTVQALGKTLFS